MNSRVTVIVPTYNRAHFLPECLDALLNQTVSASEIIVVNDGSTDRTPEALATFRNRIVYLEKKNGGKASALNMGLKRATGDFIWIFDDDDIPLPDAIETHLNAFANDPSADFTYSGYHVGMPDADTGALKITETLEAFRGPEKSLFLAFAIGAYGPQVGFMLQQGMLVRKTCYEKAGSLDESLSRSEDLDMNLRLCSFFRGVRIDRPTFIIRGHEGVRGPSFDLYSFSERERKLWETDRRVFSKMYGMIPLCRYIDAPGFECDLQGREGEALVNRARVMAKRNLDHLVDKDLEELKGLISKSADELNETVLRGIILIEALYRQMNRMERARLAHSVLKELLRLAGDRNLRRYVAKYYYWNGMENFSKGRRWDIFRGIMKALNVLI